MLETIKLVAGTVAEKDLVPAFTHIHIYSGRIQGTDGKAVAIDAECPELGKLDATVPADRFLRAINACDGEPIITEKNGKISIRRASFRANLPLMGHELYPKTEGPKDAPRQPIKPGFVGALKRLKPFVSQDASRPWSCSILFTGGKMYATNNAAIASLAFPFPLDNFSIPTAAVDELIRIGQDPKEVTKKDDLVYFIYPTFWVRIQPMVLPWPDVEKMFAGFEFEKLPLIPGQLADAVRKISAFHPDPKFPVVQFNGGGVHTLDGVHTASVEGIQLPECKFRAEIIGLVLAEAIRADFSPYPKPMPFFGMDQLRGLVMGVRA